MILSLPIEYKGVDEEDIVDINDGKPFLYTNHPMYQTTPLSPVQNIRVGMLWWIINRIPCSTADG